MALPSSLIRIASNVCAGPEKSASKRLEACDGAGAGSGAFQSPHCLAVQLLAEFPELPIRAGLPHEISIGEPPTPATCHFAGCSARALCSFLTPPRPTHFPRTPPRCLEGACADPVNGRTLGESGWVRPLGLVRVRAPYSSSIPKRGSGPPRPVSSLNFFGLSADAVDAADAADADAGGRGT